ncbi:membrane protein [Mycobacterium sp. SWH-M1]|nr:membrane protein [Mycobacterium sp. SWH-M1]
MADKPKYMAVQGAALIVAVALTVVGVLGFIPGITSGVDRLSWAGQHSGALLFGMFLVSVLLNVVHIVVGVAGFVGARSYAAARAYLLGGGLIYLGLWLYGLLVERGSNAHVIPLNGADNWLHAGIGAVMVLLAVTLAGQHDPTKRRSRIRRAASH